MFSANLQLLKRRFLNNCQNLTVYGSAFFTGTVLSLKEKVSVLGVPLCFYTIKPDGFCNICALMLVLLSVESVFVSVLYFVL